MVGVAPAGVIILAAGDGQRQGQLWPKPFSLIDGRPLVVRLQEAVIELIGEPATVVMRPEDIRWAEYWSLPGVVTQSRMDAALRVREVVDQAVKRDWIVLLGDTLWFPTLEDVLVQFWHEAERLVPHDGGAAGVGTIVRSSIFGLEVEGTTVLGRDWVERPVDVGMYFLRAGFVGSTSNTESVLGWLAAHAGLVDIRLGPEVDFVDVGTPLGLVEADHRWRGELSS